MRLQLEELRAQLAAQKAKEAKERESGRKRSSFFGSFGKRKSTQVKEQTLEEVELDHEEQTLEEVKLDQEEEAVQELEAKAEQA